MFSDDLLWLVYGVLEYIEFTNNYEILEKEVEYLAGEELKDGEKERYDVFFQSDIKEPIYVHCNRAIEKVISRGLEPFPKIGTGDWNDGFSEVGTQGKGQSIWLGFFFYDILNRWIKICFYKEDEVKTKRYEQIKENLKIELNAEGWDGRWYKRAITDNGKVIGSMNSEEARIDSLSQSWSVISNAGDNDKKFISMESARNNLVDYENGIIKLFDPAFENGEINPGYIKGYKPGVRENGGQYTHAAIWFIMAEAMLGFGDEAVKLLEMINPINHSKTKEAAQKYKVEPYVIAADVYSNKDLIGRGGWTWYTGSSSWYYKVAIEYILGLKIKDGYLYLEPSIDKNWKEYEIRYKYKTTIYNIKVKNPNGKSTGVTKFFLNGDEIKEKKIFLQDNEKFNSIEIFM
jgi:cellobiose phosphorylase